MKNFNYHQSTKILFGIGRIKELPEVVLRYGKKVLLVTTPAANVALAEQYSRIKKLLAVQGIKEVKKRWGKGQEDIFPVTQFEKLWGDMTAIPELTCSYINVSRMRGQQLKEVSQLDGWLRDGSKDYIDPLCLWGK